MSHARRLARRAGAALLVAAASAAAAPPALAQVPGAPALTPAPGTPGAPGAGVPGMDPNLPITERPDPTVLPTEPNFQYFNTPRDISGCPFATTPPPVVDESEVPRPGETVPPPPEVPAEPAGGEQLGGCEAVAADGFRMPDTLTASAWILVDADTRQVLAAQDPHARHRPASIIKVLLALVVLDELDLEQKVTIAPEDIADAEGTVLGIGPGGRYTVEQLLQGLLMLSGNDAAYALAAQLGGPDATLQKMADKCAEIGCTDTNPRTVSGLDKPGNMTSAYDMALMFSAALEHDEFRRIISTDAIGFPGYPDGPLAEPPDPRDPEAHKLPGTPGGPQYGVPDAAGNVYNMDGSVTTADGETARPGFLVYNDNQLLANYPGALGGKTGFTDDARQTYIGAAERDGRRLFVVSMDGTRVPKAPWEQAAALMDAGFALPADTAGVGELVGSKDEAAAAAGTEPDYASTAAAGPAAGGEGTRGTAEKIAIGALGVLLVVVVVVIARLPRRRL